jgi:hypothetical protein
MRGFRARFNSFHWENIDVWEEVSGAVHHGIGFGSLDTPVTITDQITPKYSVGTS